jgi:hypothetical protein
MWLSDDENLALVINWGVCFPTPGRTRVSRHDHLIGIRWRISH